MADYDPNAPIPTRTRQDYESTWAAPDPPPPEVVDYNNRAKFAEARQVLDNAEDVDLTVTLEPSGQVRCVGEARHNFLVAHIHEILPYIQATLRGERPNVEGDRTPREWLLG